MTEQTAAATSGPTSFAGMAREYLVMAAGIVLRRWKHFLAPIAVATALVLVGVKMSPTTYVARALLLIQSANRPVVGVSQAQGTRQTVLDQMAALDAWLKSDEVLGSLLPGLVDPALLTSPERIWSQMKIMRTRISMELVGGSAIEVRLEGSDPAGLGGRLEVILERLMEGLLRPERGILSAQQFLEVHQREAVLVAEAALSRAIVESGLPDTDKLRPILKQLNDLKLQQISGVETAVTVSAQMDSLRQQISDDPRVLARLELLYAQYHVARQGLSDSHGVAAKQRNYVGIFESPENLLLVGRPQDPVYGERPAKKIGVALILLCALLSAAYAATMELLYGALVTAGQFASVTGLPVIARVNPKGALAAA